MLKIRFFEEKVIELYREGTAPGLGVSYIGQEAGAVGVCANLRKDDFIISTHRGNGHCIAKGMQLRKLMAELLGKETGCCKGKGGSMHLCDFDIGIWSAMGIVGAGIPIATGVGLAIKLKKTDQVVVCFFGDGASNTGAFHEGVNMAALWKLPVVFICENNLYALSTSTTKSTSVDNIADRGAAYNIPYGVVDGNDVIAVYEATRKAVNRARGGAGPTLLECKTYRWRGSSEADPDRGSIYRTKEEMEEWMAKCPIKKLKTKLIGMNLLTEEEAIEQEVMTIVGDATEYAKKSPYPIQESVFEDLFS